MALESIQQLKKIIQESRNVLIFLPESPSGDAIGAGWAFYFFLKKSGFETTLVFADGKAKEKLDFLAQPEKIQHTVSSARDFILVFNTRHNKITNVRTEKGEDELKIFITPEYGAIDPRDFSFVPAKFKYDLAIVLDSPDKEKLGQVYLDNPDIFYEIPVVNFDYHVENEKFGQLNFVDITASSVSEIITEVLEKIDPSAIDGQIAECLLAGIMSATGNFQKKNTTPKSLKIAAQLMDLGADQQKIVRYLYKTQPFQILKLWGRIMARLKWNEKLGLAWASVPLEDFVQSRTKPEDLLVILEKLKENFAAGKYFMLIYQKESGTSQIIIQCLSPEEAVKVQSVWHGKIAKDTVTADLPAENLREAEIIAEERMKKLDQKF